MKPTEAPENVVKLGVFSFSLGGMDKQWLFKHTTLITDREDLRKCFL